MMKDFICVEIAEDKDLFAVRKLDFYCFTLFPAIKQTFQSSQNQ